MSAPTVTQCHSSDQVLEQLLDEITVRIQEGEVVEAEEYRTDYPDYIDRLQRLLPAMQALVAFGRSQAMTSDGATGRLQTQSTGGILGDFRIIRELGQGGMGIVYEAEQISVGRQVALKVLPFASMLDERRLARFRNEVRAAGQLHHTNIVPIFAVGSDRGVHFYAMQLIAGQTLADIITNLRRARRLDDIGPVPPDSAGVVSANGDTARAALSTVRAKDSVAFYHTVAQLGIQAAEALEHAHTCGVVHRDIKPSNLLIDERGSLWLTDFGLAYVESDSNLTMTGDLLGTLRYMSPEQTLGSRVVLDHRTDIYSLGATLYELVTLSPAFDATERMKLLRQINDQEPLAPHHIDPAVPADLETIVLKAMSKDVASRYASGQHMADDLRRFLDNKPIQARRPSIIERGRKWAARHAALVAITAAALAVVAIAATTATFLTHGAYIAESKQRAAAEANIMIASQIIDRMLSRMSHDEFYQGDVDKAATIASDATTFYEELLTHSDDSELRFRAARAYNDVARIWELAGDHEKAIAACRRGIDLLVPLIADNPADGEYLGARGSCYLTLGRALRRSYHATDAEEPFRQAAADYQLLVDRFPREPTYQTGLAYALADIATLYWGRGLLNEAEQYFVRVDKLLENLPATGQDSSCDSCLLSNKGAILMNRALVASDCGDSQRAKELIEQAIALQKQVLRDTPGDPQAANFLFKNYANLGDACIKAGQPAAAASTAEMLVKAFPKRLDAYQQAVTLLLESARLANRTAGQVASEGESASSKEADADSFRSSIYAGRATADSYRLRAEELIAQARHAADRNPDNVIDFARFLLLCQDESFRDPTWALELAEGVVKDYPERSRAWFALALAHYRNGDWQAADAAEQSSIKFS
ncbi:MAG TPA: protein kinase, partial [Lacipirellulaceae bacterium]|nr:protein kinase [Lacipirellulaceae bacterium]